MEKLLRFCGKKTEGKVFFGCGLLVRSRMHGIRHDPPYDSDEAEAYDQSEDCPRYAERKAEGTGRAVFPGYVYGQPQRGLIPAK